MPTLEDFQDLELTGEHPIDAHVHQHMEFLADIQRNAAVPDGEPDNSRTEVQNLVDSPELPDDKKKKIKDLLELSKQISPPNEPGANDGTGKPFIDPELAD